MNLGQIGNVSKCDSSLAFLHGIGIVHGDMKPENLMLSSDKSSDCVIKVVDFGCAQVDDGSYNPSSTSPRGTANTPAYSPPEILDPRKVKNRIEPSFDMWALGTWCPGIFYCSHSVNTHEKQA